jgi:DNA-directed RNA polymerase subunit RPC12/RpoP
MFKRINNNSYSQEESYQDFDARELYCPHCKRAVPVRKRLLLILSSGEKYDYTCIFCGTSVGEKTSNNKEQSLIF